MEHVEEPHYVAERFVFVGNGDLARSQSVSDFGVCAGVALRVFPYMLAEPVLVLFDVGDYPVVRGFPELLHVIVVFQEIPDETLAQS